MVKRRILLVDDEVTVLHTMKAVLEISGYDVDTAASAREGRSKIKLREYQMVITDMRMESDAAGREVIQAARIAPYHPAVALLTAFPLSDEDWQDMGADKMLVKPMHTRLLIQQIEKLMENHAAKLARSSPALPQPLRWPLRLRLPQPRRNQRRRKPSLSQRRPRKRLRQNRQRRPLLSQRRRRQPKPPRRSPRNGRARRAVYRRRGRRLATCTSLRRSARVPTSWRGVPFRRGWRAGLG